MAGNPVPEDSVKLQQALEKATFGASQHGDTLELKHEQTRLNMVRQTLFDNEVALDNAQVAFDDSEHALSLKDKEITAFVKAFKAALVYNFGPNYGPIYQQADFPENSTEIPDDSAGRHAIFARIPGLLTANPSLVNPSKNLTLARAATLANEWRAVSGNLTTAEGIKETAETARDNAYKAARKALIALIDELDEVLGEEDVRWWDFGLNRPIDPAEPEAPANAPTVATLGPGTVHVGNLVLPRRADAIFVRVQIVGEDDAPRPSGDRVLDDTTLTGLPSGKTLRIYYCGVNDDGTGPLSPYAEIVVL